MWVNIRIMRVIKDVKKCGVKMVEYKGVIKKKRAGKRNHAV